MAISLAVLLLAACTATGNETTTTAAPTTSTTSTTSPQSTTSTAPLQTDVQGAIDWFVSILNGDEISNEDYQSRFDEEFRRQVPYGTFQTVLDDLRSQAPVTVVDRSGDGQRGEAVVETSTGSRARIVADLDDAGRFSTLLVQPAETPTLDDPPDSIDEAFGRLAELGELRVSTAEVVDGSCETIESVAAGQPAPLGSVFKLYVLAAVGEAVAAGEISWDDAFPIREQLKSIPTGELQDRDPGSEVTVREAAGLMISISDNTATDHLIDLLGRETVEGIQAEYGNTRAELNIPFLTTRELAALKAGPASGLRDPQWIEGGEAERRAILEQISAITPGDIPLQEWTDPIDPDTVEWFAAPADLCDLAVGLLDLSATVPEISEILAINPGVPGETGVWDRIWFKGGSEPGLLAVWWVTEAQGRVFVTAGSVVNPEVAIDEELAVLLFAAVRDLSAP